MRSFLITLALIIFTSCSAQRNKKITFTREDASSLLEYLNDNNVKYDKTDIATLNHINAFIEYNKTEKLVVPEAYFFNKDGNRVSENFQGEACGKVIKNIDKINTTATDKAETINDWLKNFDFPISEGQNPFENTYDGYVIINWAKFVGKKSNSTAFNWYESLKENKDLKIKVILVSLDIQADWELNDKQKNALGLE